ncbi:uncharacterized protein [Haliotis asinina]|uniref:uncharacterized protein n=1 Tax=Haliotis asinina TaxID=109174 RepID=UPI003531C915
MFSRTLNGRRKPLEVRLVPSRIHFTNCLDPQALHDEGVMGEFCRKVVERGEYPRLQVAEKDGHFFTLNNTRLHLFRRLEELGHCRKVKVERIPLKEIPEGIRQMMTPPPSVKHNKRKGYQPVGQVQDSVKTQSDDDSSDDVTETEESEDSDSDSDLSDEEEDETSEEVSENQSQEEDESLL